MVPQIIAAIRDWAKSTASGVLIGALGLSYHCKPRYIQDIDFLFLESGDVPDTVGGFSRLASGFQHNRTHIAVDIFTPSSMNIPRDVAERVIQTATPNDHIRVASASGLVALKLFRLSMQDRADIVAFDQDRTRRSLGMAAISRHCWRRSRLWWRSLEPTLNANSTATGEGQHD
jgi:hypothetical protein